MFYKYVVSEILIFITIGAAIVPDVQITITEPMHGRQKPVSCSNGSALIDDKSWMRLVAFDQSIHVWCTNNGWIFPWDNPETPIKLIRTFKGDNVDIGRINCTINIIDKEDFDIMETGAVPQVPTMMTIYCYFEVHILNTVTLIISNPTEHKKTIARTGQLKPYDFQKNELLKIECEKTLAYSRMRITPNRLLVYCMLKHTPIPLPDVLENVTIPMICKDSEISEVVCMDAGDRSLKSVARITAFRRIPEYEVRPSKKVTINAEDITVRYAANSDSESPGNTLDTTENRHEQPTMDQEDIQHDDSGTWLWDNFSIISIGLITILCAIGFIIYLTIKAIKTKNQVEHLYTSVVYDRRANSSIDDTPSLRQNRVSRESEKYVTMAPGESPSVAHYLYNSKQETQPPNVAKRLPAVIPCQSDTSNYDKQPIYDECYDHRPRLRKELTYENLGARKLLP